MRFTNIEFPRFQRNDVHLWLRKCETYFELDETPEEKKVMLASFHLDDKAFQWHMSYERSWKVGRLLSWDNFSNAIKERFGPSDEAIKSELIGLRQRGSLTEFDDKFDSIIWRLKLSEEYVVQTYIAALSEDFAGTLRLFNPTTLREARRMARLIDFNMQQVATASNSSGTVQEVCSCKLRQNSSHILDLINHTGKGSSTPNPK